MKSAVASSRASSRVSGAQGSTPSGSGGMPLSSSARGLNLGSSQTGATRSTGVGGGRSPRSSESGGTQTRRSHRMPQGSGNERRPASASAIPRSSEGGNVARAPRARPVSSRSGQGVSELQQQRRDLSGAPMAASEEAGGGSGGEGGSASSLDSLYKNARASGSLNLSNKGLQSIADKVFKLAEGIGPDEKWWEVADLQKLVLSHNCIKSIQDDLGGLASLTLLDVSHNRLSSMPATTERLTMLKTLDISGNALKNLGFDLGCLPQLVRLRCSNNLLTCLSASGKISTDLVELKAGNNKLMAVPGGLNMCTKLALLDLSGNKLAGLDDGIFSNLHSLTEIDLSKNALTEIPTSISLLSKLARLNLRQNRLTSIPSTLGSCASLAELYLGYNALETVPPAIADLQKLGSLELRANRLQELPLQLCSLQLSLLDLSDNSLGSLPSELGLMTSLRRLVLDGNPLRGIRSSLIIGPTTQLLKHLQGRLPSSEDAGGQVTVSSGNVFGEGIEENIVKSVTKSLSTGAVVLQGLGLTEVPPQAWEESRVVSLDLSKNAIFALPPELAKCVSLKVLSLADNKLSEWPSSLWSSLTALQELFVARNPITEFPPDAFVSLGNLKELDLTGVSATLPASPSLSLMPLLERLHLRQTKLREIPAEICELTQLRFLDLGENCIVDVPEDMSVLTAMEQLDLSCNDITALPPKLGLLEPTLRSLKLEGNPLRSIRRAIIERGTKALLQYLKDKIPE